MDFPCLRCHTEQAACEKVAPSKQRTQAPLTALHHKQLCASCSWALTNPRRQGMKMMKMTYSQGAGESPRHHPPSCSWQPRWPQWSTMVYPFCGTEEFSRPSWAMQRLDLPFHLVHKAPIVFGTANVFQVHATSSRWLLQGPAASWRKTMCWWLSSCQAWTSSRGQGWRGACNLPAFQRAWLLNLNQLETIAAFFSKHWFPLTHDDSWIPVVSYLIVPHWVRTHRFYDPPPWQSWPAWGGCSPGPMESVAAISLAPRHIPRRLAA